VRVAKHGGDTMLPRIGIMQALYPGTASADAAQEAQKKPAKRYWIVR
jgi:hypothetical protein